MKKFVFVCVVLLLATQAQAQERPPLIEIIPATVVDHLMGKTTVKQFCTYAATLRNRAISEGTTDAPWMRPFLKMSEDKCGILI